MGYMSRKWISHHRKFMVVDKYHTRRMMPDKKSIREKRKPRTGLGTSQTQEKINLRLRAERLSRLIMDNFDAGDWYITFTLERDMTEEDLRASYSKMMRTLRRWYKKQGVPCKYIAVLENLKNGGRKHGHILLPAVGIPFSGMRQLMRKAWPTGEVYLKPYGGEAMDASRLASYYVKEEVKKDGRTKAGRIARENPDLLPMRGRLLTSHNLLHTEPVIKKIKRAETYREEIRAPKGYHVVPELSYNGFTEEGYPYQHAVFESDVPLPEEENYDYHHHRQSEGRRRQDRNRHQRELPACSRTRQKGPARRQ